MGRDLVVEDKLGQPRPCVTGLAPYVPGRHPGAVMRQYGLSEVVKLASNENPFGPSPRAVAAATEAVTRVNGYPDGATVLLRERLAALHGVDPASIILGCGSDELILMLAIAYLEPGREAIMASPPYSTQYNAVTMVGGTVVGVPLRAFTHDLEAMAAAISEHTALLFVTNPHNPTGTAVGREAMERLMESVSRRVIVVVDEAYHQFVDEQTRWSGLELRERYPQIVTLRTFSKAYGLAGMRVGYAVADPEIIALLHRVRMPFNVNAVAQAAALAALDDTAYVTHVCTETRNGRARLEQIAGHHGLDYVPSQTNFVMMRVGDSMAVAEQMMRHGVIVRPGENLGVPGWIRVSVGTAEELDTFERAFAQVWEQSTAE